MKQRLRMCHIDYACLSPAFNFIPIALEALCPLGPRNNVTLRIAIVIHYDEIH